MIVPICHSSLLFCCAVRSDPFVLLHIALLPFYTSDVRACTHLCTCTYLCATPTDEEDERTNRTRRFGSAFDLRAHGSYSAMTRKRKRKMSGIQVKDGKKGCRSELDVEVGSE